MKPLSDAAARQTFIDIAEDYHRNEDVTQLLSFTDNMPLAVDLIAHLVDSEGCSSVLARWEAEKTSILSGGYDKRSNLDISITISLSSPRMNSGAKDLLSLLSILPDGLSDIELLQSKLPITNIQGCKAILLGTSLAYIDDKRRLKSLVPIREHMQHFHPASSSLVYHLQKHFHQLLDMYDKYFGTQQMTGQINQINSNLGNLHQVLLRGLYSETTNLAEAINCTISLNSFSRLTDRGYNLLMNHIPAVLRHTSDERLVVLFITEELKSSGLHPVVNAKTKIAQATSHLCNINDPVLECELLYSFD